MYLERSFVYSCANLKYVHGKLFRMAAAVERLFEDWQYFAREPGRFSLSVTAQNRLNAPNRTQETPR